MASVRAHATNRAAFERAETVLDRLDLPDSALENLCELVKAEPGTFLTGDHWAAALEVDDTPLLVRGDRAHWAIYAPSGVDESDAALAARTLHGLLGEKGEGWDLDR